MLSLSPQHCSRLSFFNLLKQFPELIRQVDASAEVERLQTLRVRAQLAETLQLDKSLD
jgi:hypothetical protein